MGVLEDTTFHGTRPLPDQDILACDETGPKSLGISGPPLGHFFTLETRDVERTKRG